jgi:hypothetical protein
MLYINDRFGNRNVFQDYIQQPDLIIPGEIQHSYWHHLKWLRKRKKMSLNFRNFLWGGSLFEFTRQNKLDGYIAIGDPFLYHLRICNCKSDKDPHTTYWAIYPQFVRELKVSDRFKNHKILINEAKVLGVAHMKVFFHPWEQITEDVINLYSSHGIQIQQKIFAGHPNFLAMKHIEYLNLEGLITNYIGPHVFRASLVGVKSFITSLKPEMLYNSVLKTSDIEVFKLSRVHSETLEQQQLVSEFQLGKEYLRAPNELSEIFYSDGRSQFVLKSIRNSRQLISKCKNFFSPAELLLSSTNQYEIAACEHCYSDNLILKQGMIKKCRRCCRRYFQEL